MSIWIPRIIFTLIFSMIFLSVPMTASGIMLEINKESEVKKSLFEELLQTTDNYSFSQSETLPLYSTVQAKQAIHTLEKRLRQMGDIGAIAALSPRIIELLPNDQTIHYLYAIALAARGDASAASNLLSDREPDEKNILYALLAKSAIAKAAGKPSDAASAAKQAIIHDSSHPYAYNLMGQIHIVQGNNRAAIDNFRTAVGKAPQFAAAHSNLGMMLFLQGDNSGAWQSFTKSIEISPEFCPALIGRSALSSQLGNTAKATQDLKSCLNSNPKQLQARKRLTAIYLHSGQLDKATAQAKTLIDREPIFTRMTLAEIHLRNNQPAEARDQLKGISNQSAQGKYLMSFCDALEGNLSNAITNIKLAERIQPESPTLKISAYIYAFYDGTQVDMESLKHLIQDPNIGALGAFVTGNIHASQNNFKEAYEYWSQAGDLLPGFILAGLTQSQVQDASTAAEQRYLSMGMLYYLKNYYAAALLEFDKAIYFNPDSFMANFFSALTQAQAGNSNKVANNLSRSIKKAPGFFPANYMLAEHYLKQGDVNNALKYYLAAADSEPDQGVLVKLGLIYDGQGKTESAEKTYQRFIDNHPYSFLGYNQLAWLYAKQGIKLNEAMQLAKKADELRPENSSINDTIGWIYFQKRNYKEADSHLKKANLISHGKNPDILYHLAAVHYENGRVQDARTQLNHALAISDRFESIDSARQLLSRIEASGL